MRPATLRSRLKAKYARNDKIGLIQRILNYHINRDTLAVIPVCAGMTEWQVWVLSPIMEISIILISNFILDNAALS